MRRLLLLVWLFAVVVATSPNFAWGQADPRIGIWKLNVARSKYVPGPPPSRETRAYEIQGRAMTVSIESADSHGHKVELRYTASDDGKDSPVTGLAFADSIAVKRVDTYTFDMDTKKSGKVIGTSRAQFSHDGKVLTLTSSTTGADGKPVHNVAVYDKQ